MWPLYENREILKTKTNSQRGNNRQIIKTKTNSQRKKQEAR